MTISLPTIRTGAWSAFLLLHACLFSLDLSPASRRLIGDEVMYRSLAEQAAHGGSATPDLLWPPLYSWLLSAFARMGEHWTHVAALAQVALLAGTAVLFAELLTRMTGSVRVGTAGQALMLVDPHLAAYAHYLWPEMLYVAELVLLLWLLVARPGRRIWWIGAGITAALTIVTKNVLSPYLWVCAAPLALELGVRRAVAYVVGIVAVAAALLGPVVLHNGRTHGAFVASDSSRFALLAGLTAEGRRSAVSDGAGPAYLDYLASGSRFDQRQEVLTQKLADLLRTHGATSLVRAQWQRQYFRLLDFRNVLTEQLADGPYRARGVGYINPGPWLSALLRTWNVAVYALVLAAAGIGLFSTPVCSRPWLLVVFGVLAYGLALFFVAEARSRYRLPLMLPLWTGAALALAGDVAVRPRWRLAAGAAASCALLAFAFGGDVLP